MSPRGTEQTLDLIKRALTGARRHTPARTRTMRCAPAEHKYTEADARTDQEGACGSDHLPPLGDVQWRSRGARAHTHTAGVLPPPHSASATEQKHAERLRRRAALVCHRVPKLITMLSYV